MKNKQHLTVYILFSTVLAISNANPLPRYVLPHSPQNLPMNYFDENIFYDPRLNQYTLSDVSNFESRMMPTTAISQENVGIFYGNDNQNFKNSGNGWRIYTVNGQNEELSPAQILKDPLVFPSRGFPMSPVVKFDMVKGTRHEMPSEVPVNPYDISFGPSASHVGTATIKMKPKEPYMVFPKHNIQHEREDFHVVDKLSPEQVTEVTTHKIKAAENVADNTTAKVKHVSTASLPPVPTLSPWLDGFGK